MGMPEIYIDFNEKKENFIYRLGRGIVAYVHVDSGATSAEYYTLALKTEVESALSKSSATGKDNIVAICKKMFDYGASKIILCIASTADSVKTYLETQKFNYLAVNAVTTNMVEWAEGINFRAGRKFMLISDGKNCTTTNEENKRYLVSVYPESTSVDVGTPADIAAVIAGSGDRSATYQVLGYNVNIDGAKLANYPGSKSKTANAKIDAGLLTLVNDGEKIKVGRAVNTYYHADAEDKSKDTTKMTLAKVRGVDICNMIEDDIRDTFDNQYVGQVLNSYKNKMAFISLINTVYLAGLEGDALEETGVNQVDIDVEAHYKLAQEAGKDVDNMTEMELRQYNTGSHLYLVGSLSIVDTMEDLRISFSL